MKKFVVAGCSVTAGTGWDQINLNQEVKTEPLLWVNLCHKNISRFRNCELVNVGQNAASNSEIFQNAVREIAKSGNQIDTVFCQWTSMPRYSFRAGFELWNTLESLHDTGSKKHDINLNKGDHWPREYVADLLDRLRVMHHLHWEILKVVDYCSILNNMSKQYGFDVFFINGLCPWDDDYFHELHNVEPEQYTDFTKKDILNIDSRDDKDIHHLYHLAHTHYQQAGGISHNQWINLYNSFGKQIIDRNFDQAHPGKQSNEIYYSLISNKLSELNYI